MRRYGTTYLHEVKVTSEPAVEPLNVDVAKAFMRIDYADDDGLISAMITSARLTIERHINRALITQTIKAYYTSYGGQIKLPFTPVQSVTTVTQITTDNSENVLIADQDYFLKGLDDKIIDIASSNFLPAGHSPNDDTSDYMLEIEYIVGYGDASTDVPQPIIEAIKRLVLTMYDNREDFIIGETVSRIPYGIKLLLNPWLNII